MSVLQETVDFLKNKGYRVTDAYSEQTNHCLIHENKTNYGEVKLRIKVIEADNGDLNDEDHSEG